MDELLMLLQAKLDEAKSKGNINSDIKKIQGQIDKLKVQAEIDPKAISSLVKQLEGIINQKINITNINVDVGNAQKVGRQVGQTIANATQKEIDKVTQKANKIQLSTDVTKLTTDYQKFGVVSQEVENNLKELKLAQEAVVNAKGTDRLATEIEKYNTKLAETKSSLKELTTTQVSMNQRTSQMTSMQEWMRKNKNATKLVGDEVNKLIEECKTCDAVRFNGIKNEFKDLQVQAGKAGKLGNSLFGSLKDQAKNFTQWISVSGAVMEGVQTARQMYQAVYDIDTAMTNLYKVTDETDEKYNQFLNSACDNAQRLGRSVSSLVEQTANWAKLGYNIDQAEQLAQISSIYANVGEVDDATAVSDMVTAMKAFNIEASNAITIVDMLNTLGNKYATSAADLGSGLSRSASAMATAGTDIEKTLAMLTGGSEITQSAEEFGNMLKIGSMRVRGMKGELEALGEEVDKNMESISKIQTQVLNLTHGKVNIFNDNGEFKDYYDIMEGVAKIYSDLSSTEQASLSEILFGKQRGNQGAALIQAFQSGQIQKAYADIQDSAGSAYEEQARWMESLEAKAAQFEAAFQSLSNTVLDSGLLKGLVDLGTISVKSIDDIINGLGQLNSFFSGGFLGLNSNGISGTLGAISGLLMNKSGIGKRTVFQW